LRETFCIWHQTNPLVMSKESNTEWMYRIRYPDPAIKVNDTVKIDLATGKITDFIKFDTGVIAMVTGGRNMVCSVRSMDDRFS
jgi:ribosomal protein S4E